MFLTTHSLVSLPRLTSTIQPLCHSARVYHNYHDTTSLLAHGTHRLLSYAAAHEGSIDWQNWHSLGTIRNSRSVTYHLSKDAVVMSSMHQDVLGPFFGVYSWSYMPMRTRCNLPRSSMLRSERVLRLGGSSTQIYTVYSLRS